MMNRFGIVLAACALAGCGSSGFDQSKVKALIEEQPVKLESEQVALTQGIVDCGVQNELWEAPTQVSTDRSVAKLTDKGRALKFSDDVSIGDAPQPYVQVRGDLPLQVDDVPSITDVDANTKRADVKAGVKIDQACFPGPLPIMGVKKGNFNASVPPAFRFTFDGSSWHLDRLVH